jgi:hypothetical protein
MESIGNGSFGRVGKSGASTHDAANVAPRSA